MRVAKLRALPTVVLPLRVPSQEAIYRASLVVQRALSWRRVETADVPELSGMPGEWVVDPDGGYAKLPEVPEALVPPSSVGSAYEAQYAALAYAEAGARSPGPSPPRI